MSIFSGFLVIKPRMNCNEGLQRYKLGYNFNSVKIYGKNSLFGLWNVANYALFWVNFCTVEICWCKSFDKYHVYENLSGYFAFACLSRFNKEWNLLLWFFSQLKLCNSKVSFIQTNMTWSDPNQFYTWVYFKTSVFLDITPMLHSLRV